MKIYDGTEIDIDIYDGQHLVGQVLGRTTCERCPFCGALPHPRIFTSSKCGQCGADYKQAATGRWYWERDVEGERQMHRLEVEHYKLMLEGEEEIHKTTKLFLELTKEKVASRNRIIKNLRAALKNARTQAKA